MALHTIKKRKDFLLANTSGSKFIVGCFILQSSKRAENHPVDTSETRIGFTVTKKMGGAVARNRIKRRLREAVRPVLSKYGKPGYDYVIISRQKSLNCDFSELQRDMEFAFSRIILHKNDTEKTTDPNR